MGTRSTRIDGQLHPECKFSSGRCVSASPSAAPGPKARAGGLLYRGDMMQRRVISTFPPLSPPVRPCPRPGALGEEASWPRQRREAAGAPHVGAVPWEGGRGASLPPSPPCGATQCYACTPLRGAGPSRAAPTLRPLPVPRPAPGWQLSRTPLCGDPRGWG